MKRITEIVVLLMIPISAASAANKWIMSPEVDFNLPNEVQTCLEKSNYKDVFAITGRINPMYLRVDVKGDGKLEYVLFIQRVRDRKDGLLICDTSGRSEIIFAGNAVRDIGGDGGDTFDDDLNLVDYWFVYKGALGAGFEGMPPPPKAKGEVIGIGRMETWSKALYWTGKRFITYQLGD